MAVEITRTDMSASELRTTAARTKDAKAARRMLAIALVLDGTDRRTAAEACGMDRQTLRDWVHRYNADGLAGLSNRYAAGPTPLLNPEQKVELARMVRKALTLRPMGWCAGAASISSARSRTALAWSCTSGRLANNWRPSAFAAFQCAPSTPGPTPWRKRHSKKLCRYGEGRPARGSMRQAIGGVVPGRGQSGPAGDAHPDLG